MLQEDTAYGKSPKALSKGWWRNFIRQAAAAGFVTRIVKTAKFGESCGVYASLSVSDEGRRAVAQSLPVLLPVYVDQSPTSSSTASKPRLSRPRDDEDMEQDTPSRRRKGKGCHLLPLVKSLLQSKENWKTVTDKESYQYLGTFPSPSKNFLWYVDDVIRHHHTSPRHADQFQKMICSSLSLFVRDQ